jgi:FtsH-binding integral membrane protein
MNDLPGYVLFLAIAVLGLGTVAIGTVRAWIWLDARRLPVAASVALTILFAAVTFLGFWMVLDVYWLVRAGLRAIDRKEIRPTEPST